MNLNRILSPDREPARASRRAWRAWPWSAALILFLLAAVSAVAPQTASAQGALQAGTSEERPVEWTVGFGFSFATRKYRAEDIEINGADIPNASLIESDRYPEPNKITEYGITFSRPGPFLSVFLSFGFLDYKDEFNRRYDEGYMAAFGVSGTFYRSQGLPSFFVGAGVSAHMMIARADDGTGLRLNDFLGEAPFFVYVGFEVFENFMLTGGPTVTLQGLFREGDDPNTLQTGVANGDREQFFREARLLGLAFGASYRFEMLMVEAEVRVINDTVFTFRASFVWR